MALSPMKLRDVMTRDVECVSPEASLRDAAEIMRRLDVGIVPVCIGQQVEGIITDRDIAIHGVAEGRDPMATQVREVISRDVVFCFEDHDAGEAAKLMRDKQIRGLMVLDLHDRLVGIVSLRDLSGDRDDKKPSGEGRPCGREPVHNH